MIALVMIHVWLLRFPFHSSNDTAKVVIYMLSSQHFLISEQL